MARALLVLACAWPVGSQAELPTITWTQTGQFNFGAVVPTISRTEGGGDFIRIRDIAQSGVLDFAGALAGFGLGEHQYVLTGVQATLTSTYSSVVQFAATDCCFMTDTFFEGSLQSIVQTRFSFESSEETAYAQRWSEWKMFECWFGDCDTLVNYPITSPVNRQWSWQDTSFFTRSGDLHLELTKYSVLEMVRWRDDDTWSELRNPENKWSGTVTLQYLYEAQPVPEAPASAMFVAGLLGVAALVARRRQAARR